MRAQAHMGGGAEGEDLQQTALSMEPHSGHHLKLQARLHRGRDLRTLRSWSEWKPRLIHRYSPGIGILFKISSKHRMTWGQYWKSLNLAFLICQMTTGKLWVRKAILNLKTLEIPHVYIKELSALHLEYGQVDSIFTSLFHVLFITQRLYSGVS